MTAIIVIIIIAAFIVAIALLSKSASKKRNEAEIRRAGLEGEDIAAELIKRILREDDVYLRNINIVFDEKEAELDSVVINKYGVFVIEVKSYIGSLYGSEDDYEWQKYKTTSAGNTYEKTVKNPLRQVKRQVYVLAKYLDYYGAKVWVEGYAMLTNNNSPVESEYMLNDIYDIDRVIHSQGRNILTKKQIENIVSILN